MSLDTAKLEKVRELAGGIVQARCPACAEGGGDRKGEHLRVYPDGRYGCCVHPKDGGHRKRIFALAGVRKAGTFTLRLKTPPALPAARSVKAALAAPCLMPPETELENGVRGVRAVPTSNSRTPRTGISKSRARTRGDSTPDIDMGEDPHEKLKDLESGVRGVRDIPTDDSRTPRTGISKSRARTRGDSSHSRYVGMDSHMKLEDLESGVRGVRAALPAITRPAADDLGTLGTPETESENAVPGVPTPPSPVSGTLGTPIFKSRACAREDSPNVRTPVYMCKDLESGVPSVPNVPEGVEGEAGLPPTAAGEHLPYLTPGGTLVIPFDSPERYHWWKPPHDQRQRVATTWNEVKERMKHGVTI